MKRETSEYFFCCIPRCMIDHHLTLNFISASGNGPCKLRKGRSRRLCQEVKLGREAQFRTWGYAHRLHSREPVAGTDTPAENRVENGIHLFHDFGLTMKTCVVQLQVVTQVKSFRVSSANLNIDCNFLFSRGSAAISTNLLRTVRTLLFHLRAVGIVCAGHCELLWKIYIPIGV